MKLRESYTTIKMNSWIECKNENVDQICFKFNFLKRSYKTLRHHYIKYNLDKHSNFQNLHIEEEDWLNLTFDRDCNSDNILHFFLIFCPTIPALWMKRNFVHLVPSQLKIVKLIIKIKIRICKSLLIHGAVTLILFIPVYDETITFLIGWSNCITATITVYPGGESTISFVLVPTRAQLKSKRSCI